MTRVRCGGSGRDTTGKPAKRCANGNAVIVNLGSDCFCTKICLCRRAPQRAIFQRPYFTLLCDDPTITCWPSMFGWAFVLVMFIGRRLRHSRPASITRPLRAGIFSVLSWPGNGSKSSRLEIAAIITQPLRGSHRVRLARHCWGNAVTTAHICRETRTLPAM